MKYETVRVIREEKKENAQFSFSYEYQAVSVIRSEDGKTFLRVYEKNCGPENNGRPVTMISDYAYPVPENAVINADNWKEFMISGFGDRTELQLVSYDGV